MSPSGVYERAPRPRSIPKACDVDGCTNPARTARGALCEKHYYRLRRTGTTADPTPRVKQERVRKGLPSGPHHPNWGGAGIGYSGAHMRVRAVRGEASRHLCACGAPAKQWSYDHQDPDEKRSKEGPYSVDPTHYRPMCVPCHKRFDLDRIAA